MKNPRLESLLLACGAAGSALNLVVILVLGAVRPHYDALRMPDSLLELGPGGWIQTANYLVTGALLILFAGGLKNALTTGTGSFAAPILVALYGVTFVATAIFPTDPQMGYPELVLPPPTLFGTLHNLFGQTQFLSLSAACFVLARRDSIRPESRSWAFFSLLVGGLMVASDALFIVVFELAGPAGLVERLGIAAGGCWVTLLALRLVRRTV